MRKVNDCRCTRVSKEDKRWLGVPRPEQAQKPAGQGKTITEIVLNICL